VTASIDTQAPTLPPPPTSRPARSRWELPTLVGVLLGTAVLYLWDLVAVGDGNAFYAAAVQAGTKSWTRPT
jgi:hypothetical protein